MIEIKVNPHYVPGVQNHDLRVMKSILEENSARFDMHLRNTASADDFRFYQGVVQTLDGILKILP